MKNWILITLITLSFACSQQASILEQADQQSSNATSNNTGVSSVTSQTSQTREQYSVSSFSQWIYIHNTENKILIDVNFLPEGHDLCQQATYNADTNPYGCQQDQSVSIPCEYNSIPESDLLNVNLSVSTTTPVASTCTNPIVVDLSDAVFDASGLIFTTPVSAFATDFGFNITNSGFTDSTDGTFLTFDSQDVKLEDVYDAVVDRRTGS